MKKKDIPFWVVIENNLILGMFYDREKAHELANSLREKQEDFWPSQEVIVSRENLEKIV